MENSELVLQTILNAGKALKGGEISELSGLKKPVVDKTLKELLESDRIIVPKRCYYDIKK